MQGGRVVRETAGGMARERHVVERERRRTAAVATVVLDLVRMLVLEPQPSERFLIIANRDDAAIDIVCVRALVVEREVGVRHHLDSDQPQDHQPRGRAGTTMVVMDPSHALA
jgi:hypothetical protein